MRFFVVYCVMLNGLFVCVLLVCVFVCELCLMRFWLLRVIYCVMLYGLFRVLFVCVNVCF